MVSAGIAHRVRRLPQLVASDRLAEACLLLGTFIDPDLDGFDYLGRLDRMAADVNGSTHLAIRRIVSIREGIGGNTEEYDKIDNCFLHKVLDSRRGLPIIVSAIWIEVGRRAGIAMEGVSLPGHFLVFAGGQLVDPFHFGEAIGADEAAGLVAESMGGKPRLEPAWLTPVGTAVIVNRILLNLAERYRTRGDEKNFAWVKACQEAL
ncbi:MAG TPA: transglutaminase-like domain-containing protein [Acidimicrobiia bacterium]|nr:transglutaminase-like domain-containing protein [Acidimicrobiia bacterium]